MTLSNSAPLRKVRLFYFNTWADLLEDAAAYVARVPSLDLGPLVSDRHDAALLKKARLDCDWYAENARCFGSLQHEGIEFAPAQVFGQRGAADLLGASTRRPPGEEWWVVFMGQQPQALGALVGKVCALLNQQRVRLLYYAFDEASRAMPCFADIAPHLDVLIHDEAPLEEKSGSRLKPVCRVIHRSWVANVVPYSVLFNETPEEKILFLGSQLGLTPHRLRQIDFLKRKFRDKFVAYHDHSIAVADRAKLNRFKVSVCPEGRKFTTPAMAKTHTDRPFWSGCLGLVPVSENSTAGNRLQELHEAELILRYEHGNMNTLAEQCERALAMSTEQRRRIYEHFNRHETVGAVVADAIAAAG